MLLNYADNGPGPVVVLLHGFPMDNTIWDQQITTLGSLYRVITPDLRGFGKTAAPAGAYSIDTMADDVVETLDALGITEPVIVGGLSMGGYLALSIALRYPQRVRGLMLINTRAVGDTPETARIREELAQAVESSGSVESVAASMGPRMFSEATRQHRPELLAMAHTMMSGASPLGVIGALRAMATRPDRSAELARISIPTLILAGRDDGLISLEESQAMANALPNATLEVAPDSGHLAPLENPGASNSAILRYLGTLG